MIGRKTQKNSSTVEPAPQSFDDFTLNLGDVMRGERATMGKSLLDVQRELRIKASYIAAIENCDPNAFDTPGFIAGYVRSYARYLGMDPDDAFSAFCKESGFSVAHGMSDQASTIRKASGPVVAPRARNPLAEPNLPFAPASDSFLSRIEPGAIGSSLVLLALIGGISYGGWTVLQEVQRVQVTPVDQTPVVLSEIDPLQGATARAEEEGDSLSAGFTAPSSEALDRLYRPQALDVPVLIARDAPISTLDPDTTGGMYGSRRASLPHVQDSSLAAAALTNGYAQDATSSEASVSGLSGEGVTVVAVRPAWVQIADGTGKVLYSRVMNAGDTYTVPASLSAPKLQAGESGAVYFAVNGTVHGPVGPRGQVTQNVSLAAADLVERFEPAVPGADDDLMTTMIAMDLKKGVGSEAVAMAEAPALPRIQAPRVAPQARTGYQQPSMAAPAQVVAQDDGTRVTPSSPQVVADQRPGITVVATAETWVEVTTPSGKKIFAQTLQAGQTYEVPQTEEPPTIFSGNAGGVFFAVNGQTFGPYGQTGQFGRNLALSADAIQQNMQVADLSQNQTLARLVAELNLQSEIPGR
jgi:cytoskeletal protein RodZ